MSSLVLPSPDELAGLPLDGGPKWNRLVFESSPYLLQHAANPVDWHPWGDAAFAAAEERNVPVFLSVGYATCHWCHVMERESFEDEEAAARLNQAFVCIKVDKEERPDLDEIYMTACIALTGQGGWPLTVMLTHDRKPFFAGTYFPKHSRYGRIGLLDLIGRVEEAWRNKQGALMEEAERITGHVRASSSHHPGDELTEDTLDRAYNGLAATFDNRRGGFGSKPKFPSPHNFIFLMRYWSRTDREQARNMAAHSLLAMRRGGIFDHVGFGFHRYSTDEEWLLPHFEKMLYDQAMLAMAYLETYSVTGEEAFAGVAREIFTYVLRDMTHEEGGFFSAEDADSEGEEGKFYTWTFDELEEVLGAEDADLYRKIYRFERGGNFHDEATHELSGVNIPHLGAQDMAAWSARLECSVEALTRRLNDMRERLFVVREKRIHPLKDDKVLTDWNGLMIAALAMGGRVLGEERYTQAAVRAAAFAEKYLRDDQGNLVKRFREGRSGLTAHLDDHAFLVWGLLEIHQATRETQWLVKAAALMDATVAKFRSEEDGYFYFADGEAENLILRSCNVYDGAIPSGNSVTALNLARLFRLTGKEEYRSLAGDLIRAFSGMIDRQPTMSPLLLCALDLLMGSGREIVIAGDPDHADTRALLREVRTYAKPADHVLLRRPDDTALNEQAPFTQGQDMRDGKATAYVCRDFACAAPTHEPHALRELLL
ncbi:MAG: thioredoxin domain-containing protein [Acidobacteriota bacterium]|nr:thioredoxin domain-containing protein [Acidobacteriota bacterium]